MLQNLLASQTNKNWEAFSCEHFKKCKIFKWYAKYQSVNDSEKRGRQPLALALQAKWWKQQSYQICWWIHYSKYQFTIIFSQVFLYYSSMCSYVLNVSNYFKDMIYNIWYWQINTLWYSKYKISKFRENWINLVASFAKVRKDHLLFVKVEATGVIYFRHHPFPFDESIHVIYSENFNYRVHILKNLRWVYL